MGKKICRTCGKEFEVGPLGGRRTECDACKSTRPSRLGGGGQGDPGVTRRQPMPPQDAKARRAQKEAERKRNKKDR
jgi:hypothetical protein